jgi:hypothetical protein
MPGQTASSLEPTVRRMLERLDARISTAWAQW